MNKRLVFCLSILLVLGCNAKTESAPATGASPPGTHWLKVDAPSKTGRTVYLDTASIMNEGKHIKVWSLFDHESEQDFANRGIMHRSIRRLNLYDCQNKLSTYVEEHFYKDGMGRGKLVYSQAVNQIKWFPVPSGSLAEATMEAACKLPLAKS